MKALWLPVSGWDYYEVSSLGQVRSTDRVVPAKNGSTAVRRGKVLSPATHRGYLAVRLRNASRDRTVKVHTLVLEAFVGPKPDGLEARHLNGNSTDNRADNLVWGTRSENNLDRVAHGTHQHAIKQTCPKGHEYDYIDPKGGRRCKTCRAEQLQAFYARRRTS